MSFDNAWLAENGFYNPETGWMDTAALQQAARVGMRKVAGQEGQDVSLRFAASIHYNTDNVHVHFASVEPQTHAV
ncbi:MAG: relaxase MobL [Sporolactobacillus sp.]